VATAFSTTPSTTSSTRDHIASTVGSTASEASTARPMTTTLLTVPTPGFCRNGIHSSSTRAPTTIVTVPIDQPTVRETPWCSTSQGVTPSPERTSSAIESPKSTSPT
jgi:hypothetical protein